MVAEDLLDALIEYRRHAVEIDQRAKTGDQAALDVQAAYRRWLREPSLMNAARFVRHMQSWVEKG